MLGAEDALGYGQQRGELVPGGGRIPRLPDPVGQAGAGGQGIGVLGAEDALGDGQQRGELVPGGGRVSRLPDRVGEFAPRGQGAGVLGTGGVGAHIAIGGDRVAGCGPPFGGHCRLDLPNQGPQLSLGVRVLLQQVRPPPCPPPRQSRADQLHIRPGSTSKLLACLLQPLLDQLGLLGVPAAQQLGILALARSPTRWWPRHLSPSGRRGPPVRAGSPPASADPLSHLSVGEQVKTAGPENCTGTDSDLLYTRATR